MCVFLIVLGIYLFILCYANETAFKGMWTVTCWKKDQNEGRRQLDFSLARLNGEHKLKNNNVELVHDCLSY